jgi:hypothetical protein
MLNDVQRPAVQMPGAYARYGSEGTQETLGMLFRTLTPHPLVQDMVRFDLGLSGTVYQREMGSSRAEFANHPLFGSG